VLFVRNIGILTIFVPIVQTAAFVLKETTGLIFLKKSID